MGHICSVSKSKKNHSNKKKEALYQYEDTTVDPAISLISKEPTVSNKSSRLQIIKKPAPLDLHDLRAWKKTKQRLRSLEYEQSFHDFLRRESIMIAHLPSSLKRIKEITIHLQEWKRLKLKELLEACLGIEKLDLSIRPILDMTDEDFRDIFCPIKKMVFLKHFLLHFSSCESLTERTIYYLAGYLKRCGKLESLKLDASQQRKFFTDKALNVFGASLKRLRKLKSISLNMRFNFISDEGFRLLFESLKAVKSLKELDLDFDWSFLITNQGFQQVVQEISKICHLERLALKVGGLSAPNHLSNLKTFQAIQSLDCLDQLKLLTSLYIRLAEDYQRLEKRDFTGMLNWAKKLDFIKDFSMEIAENSMREKKMRWTKNGYEKWTGDFGLYFSSDQEATSEELNAVINYLEENKTVVNVVLECTRETAAGLYIIREPLKEKNTDIKELFQEEDFKLQGIETEGTKNLCQALEKLLCLKFLYLDFRKCKKLGNKALEILIESLKKLTTLEALYLDFSDCGGFGDECFAKLSDCLKDLPCLEKLYLAFDHNHDMTHKGLIFLGDSFKSLKKLHMIELSFVWCPKNLEKGFEYLKQQLKVWGEGKDVCFEEDLIAGRIIMKPNDFVEAENEK